MKMFDLIIAAGGASTRTQTIKNKLLMPLNGRTVIENSILPFLAFSNLNRIIVSAGEETLEEIQKIVSPLYRNISFVVGGATRTQSVSKALSLVESEYVLIHDGARPFVTQEIIANVLDGLSSHEAAIPATSLTDSIIYIGNGYKPCSRSLYKAVQTPQGFLSEKIIEAYKLAESTEFTDDASVYCQNFYDIVAVDGAIYNKKITTSLDLQIPLATVGVGFDTHRLVEGRKLILGGIDIPHTKGLLGHSDADVLIHSIMDAILSALGERDIGFFFPDTAEEFKDISSVILLSKVMEILRKHNKKIWNLSATILAQKPKLSPYISKIRESLSTYLDTPLDKIGIAATTTEGVGSVGHEESISCIANVSLIDA